MKTVLISTQHNPNIDLETLLLPDLRDHVISPLVPAEFANDGYKVLANPTGKFELGGPHADAGLTGRKIIVDTYGGAARHGGGAFSGKDPSKVDRSAAYAARWVAKHVVASGAAARCEIQVAYAIGVARPVSLLVETFGTAKVDPVRIAAAVDEVFDLRPGRHHQGPRPAPAGVPQDGRLRPFRPQRQGLHLGAGQPAGHVQVGPRSLGLSAEKGRPPAQPTRRPYLHRGRWLPASFPTWPESTRNSTIWCRTRRARLLEVGSEVRVDLSGRRVGGWVTAVGVEPAAGVGASAHRQTYEASVPMTATVDLAGWAAWRWAGRRRSFLRTASPELAVPRLRLTRPPGPGSARAIRAGRTGRRRSARNAGHPAAASCLRSNRRGGRAGPAGPDSGHRAHPGPGRGAGFPPAPSRGRRGLAAR